MARHSLLFALAALALAAHFGSIRVPFLLDDHGAVLSNPSIRSFRSAWRPPPGGETVSARPAVNLSFAASFALSGQRPWGYHAVNLALHVAATLLLWALVRDLGGSATLAFGGAAVWSTHWLTTAAISYIAQRAEAMAAAAYLLALLAYARRARGGSPGWAALAVAAAWFGAGCKETIATVPLAALLCDRCLVSGSFRQAWRARRSLLLGLASCWVPLVVGWRLGEGRGGTAGWHTSVGMADYLRVQGAAAWHYGATVIWPETLVFYYGRWVTPDSSAVMCGAALVGLLAVAALVGLRSGRRWGLFPALVLLLLAPTSSVLPIATETVADHRLYLPLAVAVVGFLAALRPASVRLGIAGIAVIAGIGFCHVRDAAYADPVRLWAHDVRQVPDDPWDRLNYGAALSARGDDAGAITQYTVAVRLVPGFAPAHFNLANACARAGQWSRSIAEYQRALELDPDYAAARHNLANARLAALWN